MPTYDFLCNCCGIRFSDFASITEKNRVQCSQCGSKDITQVFSAFNFVSGTGAQKHASRNKGCSGRSCGSCPGC